MSLRHAGLKYLSWRLLVGDVRAQLATLADQSVQCVVTSPPYWGLRDYGTPGQLGLEATPDEYVANMVGVFRDVRRVLRDDGTLFLNMGDSYASGSATTGGYSDKSTLQGYTGEHTKGRAMNRAETNRPLVHGLKPKDLVGIPWRLAFALRADGWYLRADIIWAKANPMPESVTDRPTKAHEYIFLLTKNARYYYDAEAIKEPSTERPSGNTKRFIAANGERSRLNTHMGSSVPFEPDGTGRNARSVWTITTQPYPEAHFATFPEQLPERCILAGTSEKGQCAACGAPWYRVVEATAPDGRTGIVRGGKAYDKNGRALMGDNMIDHGVRGSWNSGGHVLQRRTTGWQPSCACNAGDPVPQTILDPFTGSGTTGAVAVSLGRSFVGVELNPEYVELARRRIGGVCPMFAQEVIA